MVAYRNQQAPTFALRPSMFYRNRFHSQPARLKTFSRSFLITYCTFMFAFAFKPAWISLTFSCSRPRYVLVHLMYSLSALLFSSYLTGLSHFAIFLWHLRRESYLRFGGTPFNLFLYHILYSSEI